MGKRVVGPGSGVVLHEALPTFEDDRLNAQALTIANALADYGIFAPTTPALRGTGIDYTQRGPVGLAGGRLALAVRDLLERRGKFGSIDLDEVLGLLDWVGEIRVVRPSRELVGNSVPTLSETLRFRDRWLRKDRDQISVYEASEGAGRAARGRAGYLLRNRSPRP